MGQVLEGLSPPHEGYRLLVETLEQYQELSALGGWPEIPSGASIRPGGHDKRLPLLRTLLLKTGDLAEPVELHHVVDVVGVPGIEHQNLVAGPPTHAIPALEKSEQHGKDSFI